MGTVVRMKKALVARAIGLGTIVEVIATAMGALAVIGIQFPVMF